MPTIPRRQDSAQSTIGRLLPQCDRFYVHLDGYEAIPSWMPSDVRCFVYPQKRGPSVRYSVVPDEHYVLFVDDDLQHPPDYVSKSIATLKGLGPRSAIAYHGVWWTPGSPPQYRHRKTLAFGNVCSEDRVVSYVGSGTLGLLTADLRAVDRNIPKQFQFEDDVWISGALARAEIRCVRPKTSKDWLRSVETKQSLWNEAVTDGFKRRDACIAAALALGKWKLTP